MPDLPPECELIEIDSQLQASGVPISQRPIRAWLEVGKRRKARTGSGVLKEIDQWYQRRYGEKVKVRMEAGRMPMLVAGEIYLARFPIVFGHFQVSVFKQIDITSEVVATLPLEEQIRIGNIWLRGYESFYSIQHLRHHFLKNLKPDAQNLFEVAEGDLRAAATCLEHWNLDIEGSAFRCQQAAEKFLKTFLIEKAGLNTTSLKSKKYGHNLKSCLSACLALEPTFSLFSAYVNDADFVMDIRYQNRSVGKEAVVRGFRGALFTGAFVSDVLCPPGQSRVLNRGTGRAPCPAKTAADEVTQPR